MANFCTKCGKPLINGQPCGCTEKTSSVCGSQEEKVTEASAQDREKARDTAGQADHDAKTPDDGEDQQICRKIRIESVSRTRIRGIRTWGRSRGIRIREPVCGTAAGNPYQSSPYGGPQGNFNTQWFNEKKGQFVKNTKNMFAEIIPLISRPDSTIRKISDSNNSVMGLEMVGLKALICFLVSLVAISKLKSISYGAVDISILKVFLLIIIAAFGGGVSSGGDL